MFNNYVFLSRAVYEIMWTDTVEPGRSQMTRWHMRFACWMTKSTSKHSKYAILFLFHGNNVHANAPQYYVIRTYIASHVNICTAVEAAAGPNKAGSTLVLVLFLRYYDSAS
jgi:hypothetical protein